MLLAIVWLIYTLEGGALEMVEQEFETAGECRATLAALEWIGVCRPYDTESE